MPSPKSKTPSPRIRNHRFVITLDGQTVYDATAKLAYQNCLLINKVANMTTINLVSPPAKEIPYGRRLLDVLYLAAEALKRAQADGESVVRTLRSSEIEGKRIDVHAFEFAQLKSAIIEIQGLMNEHYRSY